MLVAVLAPTALVEGLLREGVVWRPLACALGVALVFTLLWRRTHAFVVFVVAFSSLHAVDLVAIVVGIEWTGLHTNAFVLLLVYSLFRWGAGREVVIGFVLLPVGYVLAAVGGELKGVGDAIGAAGVLLFPAAIGASVRFRASARLRELDRVRLLERQDLARELHDTVAHHVSAIAIRAQAGRTVAENDPTAAVDALEVIEEVATRSLTELRSIVGALRRDEAADLTVQPGLTDIPRLADDRTDAPPVEVDLSGDLDDLRSSVEAALYRLTQESITNARRHARHATGIWVTVVGDGEFVRLTVRDDGERGPFGAASSTGFGLVGMAERAALLGGTFEAGPSGHRGWTVEVVLPRMV